MTATIYSAPDDIKVPGWEDELDADGRFSIEKMLAGEEAYIARVREWLASNGYTGELAGEHVRWPRGDGYARYLVMKIRPLWLMHLPLGDAWDMDDVFRRGLRAADIRENIEMQEKLASIFGKNHDL